MDAIRGTAGSMFYAIGKLESLLTCGLNGNFHEVKQEVQNIRYCLNLIYFSLKDAEAASFDTREINEVSNLIEDVIKDCIFRYKRGPYDDGVVQFFRKAGKLLSTMGSNITKIKALLLQIKNTYQRFHFLEQSLPRFDSPLTEECVVGIDSAANELIKRLTKGETGRSVISIVGASGIGKTTLAKKVYYSASVRKRFDSYVWVSVTRSYNMKELLQIMTWHICNAEEQEVDTSMMRIKELVITLTMYLKPIRYMIVFDDVCDVKFWQLMKQALPDNGRGSRIIITTQSDAVVASCKNKSYDHVHKLNPLSGAMCWELFSKITFRNEPGLCCPREFVELSHEFIRICQGLPSAIVDVAKLLSNRQKNLSEWKRLFDLSSEIVLNFHLTGASKIVALGYVDLPPQLKLCLLYFSIFPRGSLIPSEKLYKIWIAEGIVEEIRGKTVETVAEEYLNELIRRKMVQQCEGYYEVEKVCQVPHLLYEIVLKEAVEFDFFHVLGDNVNSGSGRSVSRLSISNNIENVLDYIEDSHVRSIFLFNIGSWESSFLSTLFEKYDLLTLLDFENAPLEFLPEELGKLFHLKYLNLKNTRMRMLPKSIGKLSNLQTLDVRNTLLSELPIEINELLNLQHLLASSHDNENSLGLTQGVKVNEGIGCLQNLQTLMTVNEHPESDLVKELEELWQLRRLGISGLTTTSLVALRPCIEEMAFLEYLSLESLDHQETFAPVSCFYDMTFLRCLVLKGVLPRYVVKFSYLNTLCISFAGLEFSHIESLHYLPNLVSIWLYQAYDEGKLYFFKEGFRKLKLLVIRELHGLEEVFIEEGALPVLEELRIGSSPLLKKVPIGIEHLRKLKVLANYDMPSEFVLSLQPDGGSDYWRVEQIQSVLFWYRIEGRRYMLYKLGDLDMLTKLQSRGRNTNDIRQHEILLTFDDTNGEDEIASTQSVADGEDETASTQNVADRLSFSSGRISFFSDDIED